MNKFSLIRNLNAYLFKSNRMISKYVKIGVLLSTAVIITISISLNIVFHRQLFLQGVQFIIDYQKNGQNAFSTVVYNLFSLLGQTYIVVAILALTYIITLRKMQAMAYISMVMVSVYFISIGKQAWHEPRPYWFSQDIQSLGWTCPTQYGHPSGHSWVSVVLFEPLVSDFFGSGPFYVLMIFPILTGAFIPLSRMYLGAHSSNQIIMGLLFSFVTVILYRYFLLKILYEKVYWRLLLKSKQVKCLKIGLIIGTIVVQLCLFMVPIIIYIVNINYRSVNQAEIDRYNKLCDKQQTYETIEGDMMSSAAVLGLLFGFIYGFAFLSLGETNQVNANMGQAQSQRNYEQNAQKKRQINYQINYVYGQFLTGSWKYGKIINFFKLLAIIIIFAGIPGGICIGLIPWLSNNDYVDYGIETLGFIIVGIVLSWIVPALGYKCQAYITQSMEKVQGKQENKQKGISKNGEDDENQKKQPTSLNILIKTKDN